SPEDGAVYVLARRATLSAPHGADPPRRGTPQGRHRTFALLLERARVVRRDPGLAQRLVLDLVALLAAASRSAGRGRQLEARGDRRRAAHAGRAALRAAGLHRAT